MKSLFPILMILFITIGCSDYPTVTENVYGSKYATWNYNKVQRAYFYLIKREYCEVGVKLEIKLDSTFVRENCRGISYGMATIQMDTLFLTEDSWMSKVDSTVYETHKPEPPMKYRIMDNGQLISVVEFKIKGGGSMQARNRLERVN